MTDRIRLSALVKPTRGDHYPPSMADEIAEAADITGKSPQALGAAALVATIVLLRIEIRGMLS